MYNVIYNLKFAVQYVKERQKICTSRAGVAEENLKGNDIGLPMDELSFIPIRLGLFSHLPGLGGGGGFKGPDVKNQS